MRDGVGRPCCIFTATGTWGTIGDTDSGYRVGIEDIFKTGDSSSKVQAFFSEEKELCEFAQSFLGESGRASGAYHVEEPPWQSGQPRAVRTATYSQHTTNHPSQSLHIEDAGDQATCKRSQHPTRRQARARGWAEAHCAA
ncbi:hypothetical protein S40293_10643 [Stachybotrys chartarum IBT 40293]|nr:hypothetical protein S40293_10643 [Stachybotrys chartarum IBT 40293]